MSGLDPAQLKATMNAASGKVRACFDRDGKGPPKTGGSIFLRVEIDASGHVGSARVADTPPTTLKDQKLIAGHAHLADTLLPPGHWAAAPDAALAQYPHNTTRAIQLLDAAGLKPDSHGIRLHLTMKTSTDETTRLEAQAMQAELRDVGIDLSLRSTEFGTFYSDITKGAFQMYLLRWIGSNEDPDIFHYSYSSEMFPPKGANRGHNSNPRVDTLLQAASSSTDEATRRQDYLQIQQILAADLPTIPLWYPDNIVIHSARLTNLTLDPGGSFDFLRTAELH